MHACTIIAKNYLAQARVLARSFLEHNPRSQFAVLIIDALDGRIDPDDEPFIVLTPQDIDCEPFTRMSARYDVLELSTAVKPWLLRQQLRSGTEAITYLDPDIQVFGSLESLDREAREHGLVLTPHNTEPIPDDGERPTQIDIMIAGVYNLGYVSMGARGETDKLLEWWCERLTRDCRVDPVYGYFVDQRWFDLAPGFVSQCEIVRQPEYNVAYWNAHTRSLTAVNGHYAVNGRPLAFFHFSGFDPANPETLSRHQTRIDLRDAPVLGKLCSEYAEAVCEQGFSDARDWPYSYGRLADGSPMTRFLRSLYALGEDEGALTESPFQPSGCQAMLAWLRDQQPGAPPGINRALAHAYGVRVDLRVAFPDLAGASREPFLQWARESGVAELGLPESLLPWRRGGLGGGTGPVAPNPVAPWGVNVVGYFRSELGVGEAARQTVSALDAVSVPVLPLHGATVPLNRQGHAFRHLDFRDARYPINLICMNADALPEFAQQAGDWFFADRYSIGLWFWEVTTAPADRWDQAFEILDEVWVPTRHVAEAVAPISPIPVVQVTLPVELPATSPVDREALGIPDGFMFLFSFDYLSVFKRKNPLALIEAYRQAFPNPAGSVLTIKCINHDHDRDSHARLLEATAGRPDIQVIDRYLDPQLKNALTATCDCYASLHRSEGFGLTMAEAMYLGKPVIATGYSGNLDFMTAENSYLVDHELVPIGDDAAPYPADGVWAQPDIHHAARLMRGVFDDQAEARARGIRAAAAIRQTHSAPVAGARMGQRLDAVRNSAKPVARSTALAPGLRPLVASGPVAPRRSPAGPIGPALRRVILRLTKPLSAYQKTINEQVLQSLESLGAELHRIGDAQQRAETTDLTQARTSDRQLGALRHDVDSLLNLHQPILRRLNDLAGTVQRFQADERALPYMTGDTFTISQHPVAGRVQGYHASRGENSEVYLSFENIFRGSEQFIRDRQRRFLELVGDRRPVLDFGCGRGEFLDLLREVGTPYVGVDSDAGMIAHCREKGHEQVVLRDGITYLQDQPPASFGAIFAAQVIEHLPYDALLRFFALARRAIAPDGILIAETVNPHSAPALKTFWVDLTHQHPIFPEVALALCRSANFERAFVFHPNGSGDIEADRYTAGEYAVVAGVSAGGGGLTGRGRRDR
jgi:SAM-dependent methyltransferase/glycosyltransferase involved in cell wall biosynthesis